jgi:hypothetical protein
MGRVGASMQIPYPAEVVFAAATRVDDLPRWLPDVVDAQLIDPTMTIGSRIRLKMGASAAGTELVGTVKQFRAPTILAIGGSAGPLTIDVRTRLDPVTPTATRIVLEIEIHASPLLGFIAREAERRINAELMGSLERLRALIKQEQDPEPVAPPAPAPDPVEAAAAAEPAVEAGPADAAAGAGSADHDQPATAQPPGA